MGLDLVASLRSKLQNSSPFSSECCIYRVPERIYYENPRAYTPRVVSIGPIHHGREALKAMEEQKILYLKSFLVRTSLSVEEYARFAEEREQKVRDHYSERFEGLKSREFVEMVAVDAAFLAEVLWRNHSGAVEESDRLFKKSRKVVDVRYDLMLLENQLPFFVLEDLFALAKIRLPLENNDSFRGYSLSAERISLVKLTHKFFRFKAYLGERESIEDFLRRKKQSSEIKHFIDFFRKFHVPRDIPPTSVIETLTVPSVTELYEAGVQFEAGPTRSLFEIEFRGRTLVIPLLRIRRSTESFFLNLLAYEQCHSFDCYVNDYVFVIDRLVDSAKAVQILARKGVIETKLPDHQEVVASIDSLIRGSILRRKHFHFNELCESLKVYLSNPWHKRITMVKHTHFSSPITVFAVVVALSIFVLTLLQTICSCGIQFK